jgi:hypothetical protein
MPCEHVKLAGGISAILCTSRGRQKIGKCRCGRQGVRLCDFELAPAVGHARSKTCDKPLCAFCAVSIGKDLDYCPDHPTPVGAQFKMEGL